VPPSVASASCHARILLMHLCFCILTSKMHAAAASAAFLADPSTCAARWQAGNGAGREPFFYTVQL
jgi:hypothetical protein